MEKNNKTLTGSILIILAGCFWGSMGIFVRRLGTYGFSSIQIVSIRVTLAALMFALVLLIKDRAGFKVLHRDFPLVSWTWIWKHPVFYGLLFYCHHDDVAFNCGNPALYFTGMDHAHVGSVLS